MKNKHLLLALLGLCVCVFTRAEVYTHTTVPSPKVYGQNYYVSNPDTVLSFETVQQLNALCTRLNTNTGVELAIVAVDQYDEDCYTAYGFALRLFNYWGIGNKETNTGVLLFLARQSRNIQIITGDGVAGMLTDGKCGELLDDNLYYFADNNFDEGMLQLCKDIEDFLMEDYNRSELMLGWTPADSIISDVFMTWIIIGFIIMALMAWLGYRRLQGKPGQPEENILKEAGNAQMGMGCLSFLFPIPMLFLYLFYRFFPKKPSLKPMKCKTCGHDMESVPFELNKIQQKETELKVLAYIRWRCPECGAVENLKFDGREGYRYRICPECGGKTLLKTHEKVLEHASVLSEGERLDTYTCQCCGHIKKVTVILPKKHLSSGGSDSDSGGGSGSWGGEHSSGGGAGRR